MIHVAVLLRRYVELIRDGEKTIECRLTRQARAPFEGVEPGERIYFKQSAGPYSLTAVADHVLFEGDLSPGRLREIRRDYNEFIRGDSGFWKSKRDARYLSLIWLRDVEEIDTGPGIRPLQGLAWMSIDDVRSRDGEDRDNNGARSGDRRDRDDSHRSRKRAERSTQPPGLSFSIEITPGNLRNNSLYVTEALEHFPKWALGGGNRAEAARPLTLLLRDGPRVETDIVAPRKLFRSRCWGAWFEAIEARAGDRVVFTPIDESTYFVGLRRDSGR